MFSFEVAKSLGMSWRDNVTANATAYNFNQEESGRVGGNTLTMGDGSKVSVSDGCCREYVRMWIFARNLPACCAKLPESPIVAEKGYRESPELRLLRKNMNIIMVAQAQVVAGVDVGSRVGDVHGLARQKEKLLVSVDTLVDKYLWESGGALFMTGVTTGEGSGHALGFDTRGGQFHFFDPEMGMFSCTTAIAQQQGINNFVLQYYKLANYTGRTMIRYSRI